MRLTDASLLCGSQPVSAVYAGSTKIWQRKARSLVDRFDTVDTAVWAPYNVGSITPGRITAAGQLTIATNQTWDGLVSTQLLSLTESSMTVELVQAAGHGGGDGTDVDSWFSLNPPNFATNAYRSLNMDIEQGHIDISWVDSSNAWHTAASVNYDPVAHRWLRIRSTGGVVYWEAAPDGKTFATLASLTPPFSLDDYHVTIGCGTSYTTPEVPAIFDNLNITPILADAFDSLDTSIWGITDGNTAQLGTATGGRAHFDTIQRYAEFDSNLTFNPIGMLATIELVSFNGSTLGDSVGAETYFGLYEDFNVGNLFQIDITANNMLCSQGDSGWTKITGDMNQIPYDPVAHRWLRLGVIGGQYVTWFSADAVTWTQHSAWTPPWPISNPVYVGFGSGYFGSTPPPAGTYAEYDNFTLL